jgi:hypothetical protein
MGVVVRLRNGLKKEGEEDLKDGSDDVDSYEK